ncbi:MAG: hypothetical protein Fur002_17400 [Anaerolineales bacterium]
MKSKIDLLRIAIVTIIFSLALIYPLLWMKMLADPAQRTGADFIAFYAAGRIVNDEGAARAYDLALQKKYEREALGADFEFSETNPFVHPPFVLPLVQLAVTENYIASFQRWALLMIAFFAAGIPLLAALFRPFLLRAQRWQLVLALFLFFPSFQSVLLGQDNALMFFGVALCLWGLQNQKDWAAGLGLALMTIRPHFVLFFLPVFLFRRRPALMWFAGFAALLALFSAAYAGADGIRGFLHILAVSGAGEGFKINETAMINLIGLLRRTLPNLSPHMARQIGWGAYALALLSFIIYAARSPLSDFALAGISALSALFFSTHTHVQDMLLFLVPLLAWTLSQLEQKRLSAESLPALPLGLSLILLFSFAAPALTHSIPYVLTLGFFLLLIKSPALAARS